MYVYVKSLPPFLPSLWYIILCYVYNNEHSLVTLLFSSVYFYVLIVSQALMGWLRSCR